MYSPRFLMLIRPLAMGIVAVLCSGCAQAQGPEQEQKPISHHANSPTMPRPSEPILGMEQKHIPPPPNAQAENRTLAKQSPIAPGEEQGSNPAETKSEPSSGPKQPDAVVPSDFGEPALGDRANEGKKSAQKFKPAQKFRANRSPAIRKESEKEKHGPSFGKAPPRGNPSDVQEKPRPIYGLPLEYHFDLPEVPQRIQGPTPMPVVSKPPLPGPLPQRE